MALEIRSRRFGYAVFQGADLLDWGVRSYPAGVSGGESAVRSLAFLLKLYAPSVDCAADATAKDVSSEQASRISKKIGAKLKRSFIPFALLQRRTVFEHFAGSGCHNKHEIVYVSRRAVPANEAEATSTTEAVGAGTLCPCRL